MDSAAILTLLICLILLHSNPALSDENSVYDFLKEYGLPVGLLPEGVTGFELDRTTGKFSVSLSDNCTYSEGKYQLKYESTVKGFMSKGKLSGLEGISLKFYDVWMNIVEILRRGNSVDFCTGVSKAAFSAEYFEESPQCGCGMNCSRRQARKLMTNP